MVQSALEMQKTKVKFQLHEVINQTLSSGKPVRPFETQNKTKRRIEIRMKCAPTKQDDQLSKIKFNSKATFSEPFLGQNLQVKIGELSMGNVDHFLEVRPPGKDVGPVPNHSFVFETIEFTTDLFKESNSQLAQKTLVFELYERVESKKGSVEKLVARTHFLLRDAFTKGRKGKLQLLLLTEKKSVLGSLELTNFTARRFYTFFDQIFRSKLNIVPVIGIDFSLANLTLDDQTFCLHSVKTEQSENEYCQALKCL